jgi:hypothetical protein
MTTKLSNSKQKKTDGRVSSRHAHDLGHRDPQNPYNETNKLYSEALWSESNHPNILGQLDPHPDRDLLKKQIKVPSLIENGEVVRDSKNRPIRDFPFLPRFLSSKLEPFRYEAYFRMDPRLGYSDLWARMPSATREFDNAKVKSHGMELIRKVRTRNNARCWGARAQKLPRRNVELVEQLTQEQIELNTTWNVTSDGIRQPGQSPTSRPLPRNYFLAPGENSHTLGPELRHARNELRRLQSIAQRKGRNSWRDVTEDHPYHWAGRGGDNFRFKNVAGDVDGLESRSVREAAVRLLEQAGMSDDSDDSTSEHGNKQNANEASGIDTVRSLHVTEADQEEDSTGDRDMSDERDDLHEEENESVEDDTLQPVHGIEAELGESIAEDEVMSDEGGRASDEVELRWVTRIVRGADGTFSKS